MKIKDGRINNYLKLIEGYSVDQCYKGAERMRIQLMEELIEAFINEEDPDWKRYQVLFRKALEA